MNSGWDALRDTHPHLRDDCKQRAVTAEHQAEQALPVRQKQDQAVPAQKTDGTWLWRFRT
ncbi:hypothetical protein BJY54_006918 [Streptomyces nodosus]|uniref:Uncharacterized protein n=1 Tax=Streptomyces nodosus TaxID=40318 RepID=A0A5P2W083_9ACTN|nr:hypothetical protein [Streptomyces nodosus]MBB4796214.1 hypothetical protein [Streptomyces nodosus]QEV37233.1 hypothetical protein CP978_00245 [Streptomyces nodosus]